jgi:hypothetical protein
MQLAHRVIPIGAEPVPHAGAEVELGGVDQADRLAHLLALRARQDAKQRLEEIDEQLRCAGAPGIGQGRARAGAWQAIRRSVPAFGAIAATVWRRLAWPPNAAHRSDTRWSRLLKPRHRSSARCCATRRSNMPQGSASIACSSSVG